MEVVILIILYLGGVFCNTCMVQYMNKESGESEIDVGDMYLILLGPITIIPLFLIGASFILTDLINNDKK